MGFRVQLCCYRFVCFASESGLNLGHNRWTSPQKESCWSVTTVCPPHAVRPLCVPGFQGAGDSSHRHHIPHRFLLLCQLCEGWHSGDAGARLLWLPSGGKMQHPHLTTMKGNTRVKCIQSFMNSVWGTQGAWLESRHCLFIPKGFLCVTGKSLILRWKNPKTHLGGFKWLLIATN